MTPPSGEIALEARDVSFSYDRPVLEGFSLQLRCGQVTGIIGPNGSGKTTALRILDGILRPASGAVVLEGRRCLAGMKRRAVARHIAMVPQNGTHVPSLTVFQFTMHGRSPHLSLLGFENHRDEEIVRRALEMTQLLPLAGRRISQISGGEKQRLLLARALAQQAPILLVDELTANLDINFQVELMRLVHEVTRADGLATLVVSHEINLLAAFADQILLMSEGRIRSQGTPAEALVRSNLQAVFGLDFDIRLSEEGKPEILPVMNVRGRS